MALPTRFNPELYQEFRPDYPDELFAPLIERLGRLEKRTSVLDLGCGTGLSLAPFFRIPENHRLVGIDRDPRMLEQAAIAFPQGEWKVASAESLPFEAGTFDALMSGSAFHWFDFEAFLPELKRVLKPEGYLFLFEYQFPRVLQDNALNSWIRGRFNREWKAPGQKPRGSLREMTEPFRKSVEWREIPLQVPKMIRALNVREFHGQILSQSRYLHSEARLSVDEIARRRTELEGSLLELFGGVERAQCDFYLSGFLFQRRRPERFSERNRGCR